MTLPYYYTDGQAKEIIKSLVYLVDTREKANLHILDYFNEKKLKYKTRSLISGDYSVMIPQNCELGIMMDTYLNLDTTDGILIERKNSLEELAGNLGRNRDRFESELERMKKAEKHLIIENGSWLKIMRGQYTSEVTSSAYYNSLLTFQTRYGLHIHTIDKIASGAIIRGILDNKVKEMLNL